MPDRFETVDGSRPHVDPLSDAIGRQRPLAAFSLLTEGDAFERLDRRQSTDDAARAARTYIDTMIGFPGAEQLDDSVQRRIQEDLQRQLSGNAHLVGRLSTQKPILIDVIPEGKSAQAYGYPPVISKQASGVFWNAPDWTAARIALRQDRLPTEPQLVVHEMAHAIHYLAFTAAERRLIYGLLAPTFGSRAAMDEVFAIYSERELIGDFAPRARRAPGVYGAARRNWSEDHVLTRFVRKLYFPHKPLAGPSMGPVRGHGGGPPKLPLLPR